MQFPCCPNPSCKHYFNANRTSKISVVKSGSYYRSSDRKRILLYKCKNCKKCFSKESFSYFKWDKKRHLNDNIKRLLCSNVSQRRIALLLGINLKTVARKFERLSLIAHIENKKFIKKKYPTQSIKSIQFDDMESSIHTKLKPVSIPIAVDKTSRTILGFDVKQMPAKGRTAKISLKKYGPIQDQRKLGWHSLMEEIKPIVTNDVVISSDENPHYPPIVSLHFNQGTHIRYPGKRGCVVGQGELKKQIFDPLFSLNHTAAMLRANINRLNRRTWCTSKKIERLIDHIALYVHFHNTQLLAT